MNLTSWLEAEKGRSALLAAHFGVSPGAVSQWKKNGVPLNNMKALREFTGGMVSLEEMVPDTLSTIPAPVVPEPAAAEQVA